MKDEIAAWVRNVKERYEYVKGNEQATKQSLIAPLFALLGYDLSDPRQCTPEYRADFGRDRSNKPVDWAFLDNGRPIFFVEAKEVGRRLVGFDEQLSDYFAKVQEVKLGILTNGVQWRFFTDIVATNIMDREPFVTWDVLADEPPHDFLTLLQKKEYKAHLIVAFAQQKRTRSMLVSELNRLLEPSNEFIRLAIGEVASGKVTEKVVDSWRPIIKSSLEEWAKQRALSTVLNDQAAAARVAADEGANRGKIVTTKEELDAFATVERLLGPERPIKYEDTASYFKIHLADKSTWVMCRLYFDRKRPAVLVPLPVERVQPLAPSFEVAPAEGLRWTSVTLTAVTDVERLGDLLRLAWDQVKAARLRNPDAAGEDPRVEADAPPLPPTLPFAETT